MSNACYFSSFVRFFPHHFQREIIFFGFGTTLLCVLGNIFVFISLQTFSISLFTIWQRNSFEILFFLFVNNTNTNNVHIFPHQPSMNKIIRNILEHSFPFDLNFDWPIRRNRYAKSKCGVMGRHTDGVFAIDVSKTGTKRKCEEENRICSYLKGQTRNISCPERAAHSTIKIYHFESWEAFAECEISYIRRKKENRSIYKVDVWHKGENQKAKVSFSANENSSISFD